MESNTFFVAYDLGVISKNPLLNPMSQRSIPMFSSRRFIVLALIFWLMVHLELIFVYYLSKGSILILFHVNIQLSKYHLLKTQYFPH